MKSIVLVCLILCTASEVLAIDVATRPPNQIAKFTLPTTEGGLVTFSVTDPDAFTVLCFLGTECPLAKLYGPRLQAMADQFAQDGVRFLGINSNVQDSMDELRSYASAHELSFPMAKDYDRSVALAVGATRTPEIVVVDRSGTVRYRGRVDDQYEPGIARASATQHDLRDAITALIQGKAVPKPVTTAVGCLISLPRPMQENPAVTYCGDVAGVLYEHCAECHRPGEIGPFSLLDYDEIVGWADMSVEVIDDGRMPPWHASDDHAELANARNMPESDKQIIRDWVVAGMPYGDAAELPTPPEFTSGWQLPREPDLVLAMGSEPFPIPASGVVEYQYYVVDPGFETDRWVTAAQVVPGNPGVVHHAIAFIRPPDGSDFRKLGLLSAYVPGQRRSALPPGYAQRVPAGSRIVFQMHYTPTGKPQSDITKIGMVFADEADVSHEVFALGGIEQEFEIPPHAANYEVRSDLGWFPRDGQLLSVMPHMHLRGKSFRFDVVAGRDRRTLVEVPAYDFNWQHVYELATPLALSDIQGMGFTATFDNSADNATNPDPTEYVTWGDQTWQEMALAFVLVARPIDSSPNESAPMQSVDIQAIQNRKNEAAKAFANDYLDRFDSNNDQVITEDEVPHSVRIFAFRRFDHDRNGQLSRDEIEAEASYRQ